MLWRSQCAYEGNQETSNTERWPHAQKLLTHASMQTCRHHRKSALSTIVPVTHAQSCLDGCLDLTGLTLPGTKAQPWHLLAIVQSHVGVLHGAVFAGGCHRVYRCALMTIRKGMSQKSGSGSVALRCVVAALCKLAERSS